MADLNTNINIIVKNLSKLKSLKKELQQSSDLAKAISKDFDRLDTLQKRSRRALKPLDDIGRTAPRDSKGRFTKDPNRKRRRFLLLAPPGKSAHQDARSPLPDKA